VGRVDQLKARARGSETRTFMDLPFRHRRREGSHDGRRWGAFGGQRRHRVLHALATVLRRRAHAVPDATGHRGLGIGLWLLVCRRLPHAAPARSRDPRDPTDRPELQKHSPAETGGVGLYRSPRVGAPGRGRRPSRWPEPAGRLQIAGGPNRRSGRCGRRCHGEGVLRQTWTTLGLSRQTRVAEP
jgi:hypothetical protein